MPIKYEIEEDDGFLLLVASGQPETADDLVGYLKSVYRETSERGYSCALVQELEVVMNYDVYDPVIMSDAIDSLSLHKYGICVAVVAPLHSIELYEYFAGVLRKRSLCVTVFGDVTTAEFFIKGQASYLG